MSLEKLKNFTQVVPVKVETPAQTAQTSIERVTDERRQHESIAEEASESTEELSLDLNSKEGLEGLLSYLEGVQQMENSALSASLNLDEIDWPEEGKGKLRKYRLDYKDLVSALRDEVAAVENEVSPTVADSIVDLYEQYSASGSDFIEFQENYLNSDEEGEVTADQEVAQEDEIEEVTAKVSSESEVITEEEKLSFSEYKAQAKDELVDIMLEQGRKENYLQKLLEKSIDKAETPEEVARIRNNILNDPNWVDKAERAGRLEKFNSKEQIEELYEEIYGEVDDISHSRNIFYARFPRQKREGEIIDVLNKVSEFSARAEELKKRVDENGEQDPVVLKSFLEKYLRLIQKISRESATYIESLTNTEAGMGELDPPEITAEAAEAEILEEQRQPVRPLILEQSQKVEEGINSEMLPTEEVSAVVLTALNENQFITDEERVTAKNLHEAYLRKVAEEASDEVVKTHFNNFKSFVNNLTENPAVDYLDERLDRIVERVDAGSSAKSDFKMTINSLKENYERVSEASDVEEERLVKAYKVVESHALQHEDLWLSVCGMRLPKAGPEGVFGARSFREGLVLVRDSHADLSSPGKKVLVNQIIELLNPVPNEGLTEERVVEIKHLAKLIDVPSSVVGKLLRSEMAEEEDSVKEEVVEEEVVVADRVPKSTPLQITEDSGEGEIEIRVAGGAEDKLAEVGSDNSESNKPEIPNIDAYLEEVGPEDGSVDVMGWTEDFDPVNKAVPAETPRDESLEGDEINEEKDVIEHAPLPRYEKTAKAIMVEKLLTTPQLEALAKKYDSTEDFVRFVQSNINRINASTVSKLDSWFGEKPGDTYEFLKGKSVKQIMDVYNNPNYAEKVSILQSDGIKYESFMAWGDELSVIAREIDFDWDESFDEVYFMWMAYLELGQ